MYDSSLKHTEKIIHIILSSMAKDPSQALFRLLVCLFLTKNLNINSEGYNVLTESVPNNLFTVFSFYTFITHSFYVLIQNIKGHGTGIIFPVAFHDSTLLCKALPAFIIWPTIKQGH